MHLKNVIIILKNNKGFTLVEVLCVCALNLIVIITLITFLEFFQTSYNRTEAQIQNEQKINIILMNLEKDIRQASKPNNLTKSVNVSSDNQEVSIYTFDALEGKYKNIQYRLKPADKTILQKGWVLGTATAPTDANPSYGAITDDPNDYTSGVGGKWKTLSNSVKFQDELGNQLELFDDVTMEPPVGPPPDRRSINVIISIQDSGPLSTAPITYNALYTSRSKE